MDSFGYCVQYCIYIVMDNKMKKIIFVKILDKREIEKKNVKFEKVGFLRCFQEIQDKGLIVLEVVIDVYLQIGVLMSKYNRGIFDRFYLECYF